MRNSLGRFSLGALCLAVFTLALASDDPAEVRHELMEDVRDAAKPVGAMLKGEQAYDLAIVAQSLQVWSDAAGQLGDLFPEGSQGGEAAPAIWDDRAGFDAAIVEWQEAIDAAVVAQPADLASAKPVLGAVFGGCKNCHDGYRIEEE